MLSNGSCDAVDCWDSVPQDGINSFLSDGNSESTTSERFPPHETHNEEPLNDIAGKYKNTSIKSIRAGIDCFFCSPPHNKPFSIISEAVFTRANKVLDAFVKDL